MRYRDEEVVELFGRRVHLLELSHEISSDIPVYPGHAKFAMWWHLTHEEVKRLRLPPDSPFGGYGVKGIAMCDHLSTHVDSPFHFDARLVDETVETLSFRELLTPAVWVDVSFVPARAHITLADLRRAIDAAGVTVREGSTFLYYTGVERHWQDPYTFNTQYPGLDEEASRWLLDQGVVNVGTDAASTDTPADPTYPNHRVHGERHVIHTEMVANITRIPRHDDFYVLFLPLRFVGATGSPVRALALWSE
jgi:kynurenine formamidase